MLHNWHIHRISLKNDCYDAFSLLGMTAGFYILANGSSMREMEEFANPMLEHFRDLYGKDDVMIKFDRGRDEDDDHFLEAIYFFTSVEKMEDAFLQMRLSLPQS